MMSESGMQNKHHFLFSSYDRLCRRAHCGSCGRSRDTLCVLFIVLPNVPCIHAVSIAKLFLSTPKCSRDGVNSEGQCWHIIPPTPLAVQPIMCLWPSPKPRHVTQCNFYKFATSSWCSHSASTKRQWKVAHPPHHSCLPRKMADEITGIDFAFTRCHQIT